MKAGLFLGGIVSFLGWWVRASRCRNCIGTAQGRESSRSNLPPPTPVQMDHKNENFNMFDLIAYRIKFVEHPHAGERGRSAVHWASWLGLCAPLSCKVEMPQWLQ